VHWKEETERMDTASIIELGEALFGKDNKYKMLGEGVMLRCPFAPYDPAHAHDLDMTPGFKVKAEEFGQSVCHCFTCKQGGSLLFTMMRLNRMAEGEFDDAVEFVKDKEDADPGVMLDQLDKKQAAKKHIGKKTAAEVELSTFVRRCELTPHSYLTEERGLQEDELAHWHLGYDKVTKRVTFPVFSQGGKLVAVYGRKLDGFGVKYLLYDKISAAIDQYFYGEQFLDLTLDEPIILVEGPLDAVVLSRYFRNVLACLGTNVTKARLKKLKAWRTSVVLMLDSDAAGMVAAKKIAKAISSVVPNVHITRLPSGKDPAECSELELKKAVAERLLFFF